LRELLFVQGGGEGTHDEWDDKLVASLRRELELELELGGSTKYEIRYPRMPDEDNPKYETWRRALEDELSRLLKDDDAAVLVGHSIGATILLHALAEGAAGQRERAIAGIFLLATPYVGEGGWPSEEVKERTDWALRLPKDVPIFFYHGTDDETAPVEHLALYAKAIPQAKTRILKNRDHQLNNDLSEVAADIKKTLGS
jgi:predicted alpha/beta hydrolase family esterase